MNADLNLIEREIHAAADCPDRTCAPRPHWRFDSDPAAPDKGEGALIAEVSRNSPAEAAGILKGDLVIEADSVPVRSAAQLRNKVGLTPVGKSVQLTIRRNGRVQNVEVEIAPAENGSNAPLGRKS